jgi:hypothetical protein
MQINVCFSAAQRMFLTMILEKGDLESMVHPGGYNVYIRPWTSGAN